MKFQILTILGIVLCSVSLGQIPANGLAVYYPFSGNVKDASGNGRDCAVNGATFTTDRFKTAQAALQFDGMTNYVLVGDVLDSIFCAPIARFSVAGWARTQALPGYQGGDAIIAKSAGGNLGPYQWAVNHDRDGRLKGFVATQSDATSYVERQSAVIPVGVWFHFVLVFDGSQGDTNRVQFYANNQPGNVSRTLGIMGITTENTNQWITIGGTHHADNPLYPANLYRGSIDDIRIYSRVLSTAEIDALFHEGNWPAVSVERDEVGPRTFRLQQNYPNPFNPSTRIAFTIPARSRVMLAVSDALGRIQKVLIDEEKPAGTYEMDWNAAGAPSGVYFCTLRAGGYQETKKMILLK